MGHHNSASSAPGTVCEVREDHDDHEEGNPTNSHHARVCNRSCSFRFDSGHGSDCGNDDSETKPDVPVHASQIYKIQATRSHS